MAYDVVVKGGLIVDGTGKTAFGGDSPSRTDASSAVGEVERHGCADDRRRRPGRRARVHRRPHALRRAAPLGPDRQPVDGARDHDRADGQLRVHARTSAARRPGLPHGPVRRGGGDAQAGAPAVRPVRLGDLRRVPRLVGGPRSASTSLHQVGHSAVRRFVMGEAALERCRDAGRDRRHGSDRRGGARRGRGGRRAAARRPTSVASSASTSRRSSPTPPRRVRWRRRCAGKVHGCCRSTRPPSATG